VAERERSKTMSSTEQEVKRLYVTMSDRPPVSIDPREWPQIAMGDWEDNVPKPLDLVSDPPPNRRWTIRVREHADGRTLVYGRYGSRYQREPNVEAGYLVEGGTEHDRDAAVIAGIRRVGEEINAPERVVREAIANLPVKEL
jgi:hypothetical protein